MDVREKLVELIESARYWGSNTSEEIADKLLENGVTVQEWIPVDKPPTKQGWYHVAIRDLRTGKYRVENDLYAVESAIAHGHSIGFCKEKSWPERDKLTHWCHYPEPPKGE